MPSGTWESAGSGFGPSTSSSTSQRRSQSTATTQQRLAPLGKKPLVTPRQSTPLSSSASTRKSTQSKLSAASFGARRALTERADNARPTASGSRSAGSSASSSSTAKGKGKQRERERDDNDAGSNGDEEADAVKDKLKKPSGWPSFAGLFSRRSSKSTSTSSASSSATRDAPVKSLGRAILNPSPASLSRRASTSRQLAFSDSDSASDGEESRKKRRRTDRGGFGKLDLVGAEESMGGMGSQEGGAGGGSKGKEAKREAIEMDLDGAVDEEQQYDLPTSRSSRSSRRDPIPIPSSPSSSSASSTGCTAETLQAQLVPARRRSRSPFSRPAQQRKPVILVPDSSPEKPMSGSYVEEPETEDDDEQEEEEEAVLDALVRRFPAGGKSGGEVDDSGFAEAEDLELDLVSSPKQEKEADTLPSVVDLSLASSSSPAVGALPARRTTSSSGGNKLIVASSSPSPSPSGAQDSPSSGSGSGSGLEGRDSLGRTASAILMPPPPLPSRKRLRRGAPSTRAAAEEAEREAEEREKQEAERERVKAKEKKEKKRARVLVEETQGEEEDDSRARALAEWDARPVDVLCDETQPCALDPAWHAFPPSSLPLPLPTPRPLANPISSPERFYPTPLRRALANSSRSRTSSSDGSSPTADQQPSASAPAALSSPLRSLDLGLALDDAELPSPEPVGLVARAASVWVRQPAPPRAAVPAASTSTSTASPALPAEVQSAWTGARPLSPPPPPEARQTKLGEFFLRSATSAVPGHDGAEGEGEEDDFVPESQYPDVSGAWTIDGVGLEAAVALQRAVEGTSFWARRAGPSGLGAVVEEEEIEEAEEGREEEEEIPDSDEEEDDAAPSLFSAALGLPSLPLPPIGPPSSPSAASSTSSSARLRLKRTAFGGASPLGTPVKRRFPVYSPSKMRAAVEKAARPVSAAAMLATAAAPQQGTEKGGEAEQEEEKEETQWESYWSYPASSPADAAEEPPKKEDRQQALLDKLLASAPAPVRARSTSAAPASASASFRQERQSSSLSPLPSSPPLEDAQPAHDDEVVDSDPEDEGGEFEESLFSFAPAVALPSGWRRDARTGELVRVRDGLGEEEGEGMEE
ncbi:hypothetical protein JCM8097_003979 [Rhodosporidiobolus ruineniae]